MTGAGYPSTFVISTARSQSKTSYGVYHFLGKTARVFAIALGKQGKRVPFRKTREGWNLLRSPERFLNTSFGPFSDFGGLLREQTFGWHDVAFPQCKPLTQKLKRSETISLSIKFASFLEISYFKLEISCL